MILIVFGELINVNKLAKYNKYQLLKQLTDSIDIISNDEYLPNWCLQCYDYYLHNLHDYAIISLYTNETGYESYFRIRQKVETQWDLAFDREMKRIIKAMPHPNTNFVVYRAANRIVGDKFMFDYPVSTTFHLVYTQGYVSDHGNIYRVHINNNAPVIFHLSQAQVILYPSSFIGLGHDYNQYFDVEALTGVKRGDDNPFWPRGQYLQYVETYHPHYLLEGRDVDDYHDDYYEWRDINYPTTQQEQDWIDRDEFNNMFLIQKDALRCDLLYVS